MIGNWFSVSEYFRHFAIDMHDKQLVCDGQFWMNVVYNWMLCVRRIGGCERLGTAENAFL